MSSKKTTKKIKNISKTSIVITILVFIVLLFMATGYAVLTQKLGITGSTELVIPDYRIYISDISIASTSSGGYASSSATHTDNEVAVYSALPNSNSSIVYEVTVKNTGNSDAIVDFMHTSSDNSLVKYKISGINSREVISRLSVKKFKIIVEASENSGDAININSSIMINFTFLKYSDSYSNECTLAWDGSSSSEPVSTNILGTDYYQISNANEFKWFMDQINNGNTSINGMLTNNICLNNASITPIATNSKYLGILDGQNRDITGISFSRNETLKADTTYNVGFFMNNGGTIKNINITGTYSDIHKVSTRENTTNLGGVVVNNTGIIENVSFNGSINVDATAHVNCTARQAHTYNYIGGIASNNSGIIRGSYNNATFTLKGSTSRATCDIYTRTSNIFAGGIASNNTGFVTDSYNKANMSIEQINATSTRTSNLGLVGGIASLNSSSCKNSYNWGTLSQTLPEEDYGDSQTGVVASNTGTLSNMYYLSGTVNNNVGTEVNSTDLINLNISLGTGFRRDLKNINNGYPILYWQ